MSDIVDPVADVDRRNHDLYRMRDLSGRLLYIGVTNGGLRRFMEHSKDKTWWREVDTINVEHVHCSRQSIEMLEREAIRSERPIYNVAHNSEPLPATVRRKENVRSLDYVQQITAVAERHALDVLMDEPKPVPACDSSINRAAVEYDKYIANSMSLWHTLAYDKQVWIGSFAICGDTELDRLGQSALRSAIAAEARDATDCDTILRQILSAGWGVPLAAQYHEYAFAELSYSDCVSILRSVITSKTLASLGNINWDLLPA